MHELDEHERALEERDDALEQEAQEWERRERLGEYEGLPATDPWIVELARRERSLWRGTAI